MSKIKVEIAGGLQYWQYGDDEKDRLDGGVHTLDTDDYSEDFLNALKDAAAAQVGINFLDKDDNYVRTTTDAMGKHLSIGKDVCEACLGRGPAGDLNNKKLPKDGVCDLCGHDNS